MFLHTLTINNFRKLKEFEIEFNRGLNLLVGENDCGKSSIIDAIKLVTGTQSNDWIRLNKDDFYTDGKIRVDELKIICVFRDLSLDEVASFLEWATLKDERYYLKLTLTARRKEKSTSVSEVFYDIKAGEDEESGIMSAEAKIKLRATYLKPLRDAEYELAPRKGSRLSQILAAYEIFQQVEGITHPLVEAMERANLEITEYFNVKEGKIVSDIINDTYLKGLSLINNPLTSKFGIAQSDLGKILEKLELSGFAALTESNLGLGSNNLVFIAAELLLLKKELGYDGLKLALVEEIEAHIHPQSQLNLIDFLNKHSKELHCQSIISTHSNTLASKVDLNNIILCKDGKAFSLHSNFTKLAPSDYHFLERFLDDTKANLFFAQSVILVEGDAENLFLPTFAEILGYPLHKYGVSIVNVGSTALLRYARIFQRKDNQELGIRVSCITDRDIPPKEAGQFTYQIKKRKTGIIEDVHLIAENRMTEDDYSPQELSDIVTQRVAKFQGGEVKVFISPIWTLEFELAKSCLKNHIHLAVLLVKEFEKDAFDTVLAFKAALRQRNADFKKWQVEGKNENEIATLIYSPLSRKDVSKAITAQVLSQLLLRQKIDPALVSADLNLKYLVDAIKYAARV